MLATIYQAKDWFEVSRLSSDEIWERFINCPLLDNSFPVIAELEVDSDDLTQVLDRAFERTNTIDRDWTENEEVRVFKSEFRRSTSVGDLICVVHPVGVEKVSWHVVAPVGFDQVCEGSPTQVRAAVWGSWCLASDRP